MVDLETPTPKPSAPRGAERRARIVEAALAVIGRVGPDALTHRLVAAEAGVPLAATTYWFASKEALIVEAYAQCADRDVAALEREAHAAASWTRENAAGNLARSLLGYLNEDRAMTIVDYGLWIEAARRPALRPISERWDVACQAFYAAVLDAVGGAGSKHDPRLFAAAVDGLLMNQLTSDHPEDEAGLTALIERLVGAFAG